MKQLQEKGAKILDVEVGLAGNAAVYIVAYEAEGPLVIECRYELPEY
jgi:hypothetical protein